MEATLVPMTTMTTVLEEVDHMVGHLEIIIQDEVAVMDFVDKIMVEKWKHFETRFLSKIYQRMLHVIKSTMPFQKLAPLKLMIDLVVQKSGFTKIGILVKAMAEPP